MLRKLQVRQGPIMRMLLVEDEAKVSSFVARGLMADGDSRFDVASHGWNRSPPSYST